MADLFPFERSQYGAIPTAQPPKAQRHSPTSIAAADAVAPRVGALAAKVLAHLRLVGLNGATDEEGILATGLAANTYRPRRIDLVELRLVRDSGRKRMTKQGRAAVVWVANN